MARAMRLRRALVCALALSAVAGCAAAGPEATACPVPTAPAETTPTACPVPSVPQGTLPAAEKPECSGGTLTAAQAFEMLSDASLAITAIDTRTAGEYEDGHIAGALLISTADAEFDEKIDALARDATYIVYCRRGNVSTSVVEQMLDLGFEHVCHIGTGFNGWKAGGFPVQEGAA